MLPLVIVCTRPPPTPLAAPPLHPQNDSDLHLSAKEVFLRSAKVSGWAIAWLGAGKAALLVGSQDQAEAGLSEANNRCVCD